MTKSKAIRSLSIQSYKEARISTPIPIKIKGLLAKKGLEVEITFEFRPDSTVYAILWLTDGIHSGVKVGLEPDLPYRCIPHVKMDVTGLLESGAESGLPVEEGTMSFLLYALLRPQIECVDVGYTAHASRVDFTVKLADFELNGDLELAACGDLFEIYQADQEDQDERGTALLADS